jgi:hypothetical protein
MRNTSITGMFETVLENKLQSGQGAKSAMDT